MNPTWSAIVDGTSVAEPLTNRLVTLTPLWADTDGVVFSVEVEAASLTPAEMLELADLLREAAENPPPPPVA